MKHPLHDCYRAIHPAGSVLDVGCWGFRQIEIAKSLGLDGIRHFGVDYSDPAENPPDRFVFKRTDLDEETIPFEDDSFDLVVASHVMEHLRYPLRVFSEFARVCRPGGLIYVEAPSERSLLLPGMPFEREKFFSLSFFDDPTHIHRPWTPQSLFRLACYYSLAPLKVGRIKWPIHYRFCFPYFLIKALLTKNGKLLENAIWGTIGWSAYLVAQKPEEARGTMPFRYYIPDR